MSRKEKMSKKSTGNAQGERMEACIVWKGGDGEKWFILTLNLAGFLDGSDVM